MYMYIYIYIFSRNLEWCLKMNLKKRWAMLGPTLDEDCWAGQPRCQPGTHIHCVTSVELSLDWFRWVLWVFLLIWSRNLSVENCRNPEFQWVWHSFCPLQRGLSQAHLVRKWRSGQAKGQGPGVVPWLTWLRDFGLVQSLTWSRIHKKHDLKPRLKHGWDIGHDQISPDLQEILVRKGKSWCDLKVVS